MQGRELPSKSPSMSKMTWVMVGLLPETSPIANRLWLWQDSSFQNACFTICFSYAKLESHITMEKAYWALELHDNMNNGAQTISISNWAFIYKQKKRASCFGCLISNCCTLDFILFYFVAVPFFNYFIYFLYCFHFETCKIH